MGQYCGKCFSSAHYWFCVLTACAGEADVILVLDSSGSVGVMNWASMLDFARKVVNELYISESGVRVGVLSYSLRSTIHMQLNRAFDRQTVLDAISSIPYLEGSATNTSGALRTVRLEMLTVANGARLNTRNIVIVITDGYSRPNPELTPTEAQALQDGGVRVFAIGIGSTAFIEFRDELNVIASNPDSEHVFNIQAFNQLQQVEDTLVRRTCREAPPGKMTWEMRWDGMGWVRWYMGWTVLTWDEIRSNQMRWYGIEMRWVGLR